MKPVARINVAPPLPFKVYAHRPSRKLPFSSEEPHCRIFSLARQDLLLGVKALGLKLGDKIPVPAYHHGSEIEALVRSGIACRFYSARQDLAPNQEEPEALLGPDVRALRLMHNLSREVLI